MTVHNGPMPSRRDAIAMTPDEIGDFLRQTETGVLTTLGRDGWPHSVAMWFVVADDSLRMWTYRKSQKVKNIQRDPRVAFLIESGSSYGELRGVLVRARAELLEGFDDTRAIGVALNDRYVVASNPSAAGDPAILAEIDRQAHKRVGIVVRFDRVASWDHRKLG